jgi:hypothetical protein
MWERLWMALRPRRPRTGAPPRGRPAVTVRRVRPRRPGPRQRRPVNWPAVTSMIMALTAIGALIFTGLSLNATRDQVSIAQSQNALSEQGQVTDQFTKPSTSSTGPAPTTSRPASARCTAWSG